MIEREWREASDMRQSAITLAIILALAAMLRFVGIGSSGERVGDERAHEAPQTRPPEMTLLDAVRGFEQAIHVLRSLGFYPTREDSESNCG